MAGCTTSLDPQGDPAGEWLGGGLLDVLRETDLFFPNEKEALAVASAWVAICRAASIEQLLETSYLGPLPVVKCGAEGALSCDGKAIVRAAAVRTVAVDTIGAGDSFDAEFVYGAFAGVACRPQPCFCGRLRFAVDPSGGGRRGAAVSHRSAHDERDIEVTRPSV